jgi:hypothetical protein
MGLDLFGSAERHSLTRVDLGTLGDPIIDRRYDTRNIITSPYRYGATPRCNFTAGTLAR